ncbi:MAG: cyclase family protein [Methanobacteriaceae archaeon]|nr:cyclase family protein [Methanobacteriaceae archaeon]
MDGKIETSLKNPKYIRLSYTLGKASPVHIGLPQPDIKPINQISKGDNYNTSLLTVENHCGTHIDAPAHFIQGGRLISDYGPDELTFSHPLVLDCPKSPGELVDIEDVSKISYENIDCLLLCTGFYQYHDTDWEKYLEQNPGLSPGAVHYLREKFPNLRCVGIDTISMSRYGHAEEAVKVHQTGFMEKEGFGKPLLFVEDLDLSALDGKVELEQVLVVPWQVDGLDGAPCTVLARIKT